MSRQGARQIRIEVKKKCERRYIILQKCLHDILQRRLSEKL